MYKYKQTNFKYMSNIAMFAVENIPTKQIKMDSNQLLEARQKFHEGGFISKLKKRLPSLLTSRNAAIAVGAGALGLTANHFLNPNNDI